MNARDAALAKAAVDTLLTPGMGVAARGGASAVLRSLGIDEYTALAGAREAAYRPPVRGPLRKARVLFDSSDFDSSGGVQPTVRLRRSLPDGKCLTLELDDKEALGLVNTTLEALGRTERIR